MPGHLAFTRASDFGPPVALERDRLLRLAGLDLTANALRVLMVLLALHDPHTGIVKVTQKEVAEAVGAHRQAVNAAFQALAEQGLVTLQARARYQLSPELFAGENVVSLPRDQLRASRILTGPRRPQLRAID